MEGEPGPTLSTGKPTTPQAGKVRTRVGEAPATGQCVVINQECGKCAGTVHGQPAADRPDCEKRGCL